MPRIKRHRWSEWMDHFMYQLESDRPKVLAVDTETSGLAFHDRAFCVTVSWHPDPESSAVRSAYFDTDEGVPAAAARRVRVKSLLSTADVLVFHNAKFDLQKLELDGMLPDGGFRIEDTQTIFNLINENERKALKILAKTQLGLETNEDERLKKVRKAYGLTKDDGYYHLPREVIIPYAMMDTEITLRLYDKLRPVLDRMIALDPRVADVYDEEIAVSETLRRMEARGFKLNMEYLKETTEAYGVRVMEKWQGIVTLLGNPEFNPNSPKQVKDAFAARGLELADTQAKTLERLDDELAVRLLDYRHDAKLHSTYLTSLLAEQVDATVHPWFNPTGARTGRMSSGSANA
jgi:DNA polymerase I-like protein with 3'-5' exonuclease and polymerase domains